MIDLDTLFDGTRLGILESHDSDKIVCRRGFRRRDLLQGVAGNRCHIPAGSILHICVQVEIEDILCEFDDVEGGDKVASKLWKLHAGYHHLFWTTEVCRRMSLPSQANI